MIQPVTAIPDFLSGLEMNKVMAVMNHPVIFCGSMWYYSHNYWTHYCDSFRFTTLMMY